MSKVSTATATATAKPVNASESAIAKPKRIALAGGKWSIENGNLIADDREHAWRHFIVPALSEAAIASRLIRAAGKLDRSSKSAGWKAIASAIGRVKNDAWQIAISAEVARIESSADRADTIKAPEQSTLDKRAKRIANIQALANPSRHYADIIKLASAMNGEKFITDAMTCDADSIARHLAGLPLTRSDYKAMAKRYAVKED